MQQQPIDVFFVLIAVHALLDFPLQGDTVAREKDHNSSSELQKHVPWYYWLSAHALVHGLGVMLVTGSLTLGMLETACHWSIDHGKCNRLYSIHVDQLLHVLCKLAWVTMAVQ